MAKVEEGDPRWIVTDMGRAGQNVGGWHWQEKNVTDWCKRRLEQLFENSELMMTDDCYIEFTKINSFKGEANIMNRKKKLIAIFELDVTIGWQATYGKAAAAADDAATAPKPKLVKGKIKLPALSEEYDYHDMPIEISLLSDNDAQARATRELVASQRGTDRIRSIVKQFLSELKAGADVEEYFKQFTAAQAAAAASGETSPSPTTAAAAVAAAPAAAVAVTTAAPKQPTVDAQSGIKLATPIELIEKFRCRPQELYECFADDRRMSAYTGVKAVVPRTAGGKFEIFSGAIEGEIVELIEGKKIVQKWRMKDWPQGHYSMLTLEFVEDDAHGGGETILKLKQTNIPLNDAAGNPTKQRVLQGWKERFFIRIKQMFGFGPAALF